jgi:hypothetical protein
MNKNITSKQFINTAHQYSKGKVCNKCNEHKLLSEFNIDNHTTDGLGYKCKSCKKEYRDNECKFKKWFMAKKGHAKNVGVDFTIEPTDIPGVKIRETITKTIGKNKYGSFNRKWVSWEGSQYPQVCSKWGVKLDWGMNGVSTIYSPSLDRIDPRFDYIPGNVRIVCQAYNMAKGNCLPDEWDILEKQIARSILGMTKPF